MSDSWERFEARSLEIGDLVSAIKLLDWDQAVMMPPKGGPARTRAMATLQAIAHARLIEPEMGELLAELAENDDLEEHQKASVRIVKLDYDKATKVPEDLVRASAEARGNAYQAWV